MQSILPRFIYFDLDDTLLDHLGAERQAQMKVWQTYTELQSVAASTWISSYSSNNKMLWEEYGMGRITKEELQDRRFRDVMNQFGMDSRRSNEIGTFYLESYEHFWEWNPGAEFVYHAIAEKFPVGIITNGFERAQVKKFERFGLDKTAKELIISEHTGYTKPHPKIFEIAAERIGCKPHEIIYVGDNYRADIEGASAVGWKTAWYNPQVEQKTPNAATWTFYHFNELLTLLDL